MKKGHAPAGETGFAGRACGTMVRAMGKLAIATALDATQPVARWPAVAVPAGEAGRLADAVGEGVLLYTTTPAHRAGYVAVAELAGWQPNPDDPGQLLLAFASLTRFPLLVRGDRRAPGVRGRANRRIPVSDALMVAGDVVPIEDRRFAQILQKGGLLGARAAGAAELYLAEPESGFLAGPGAAGADFPDFLGRLLASYGGCCAFTGVPLSGPAEPRGRAALVVFFQPLEMAGRMIAANAAPACEPAWSAMTRGDMTVGARHEFIVALDRLAPELMDPELPERLNAIGQLRLPENPDFRPGRQFLAFHRRRIFNR